MPEQHKHATAFNVDPHDIKSTEELVRSLTPEVALAAARLAVQRFTECSFNVRADDLDSIAGMIARMPAKVAEKFAERTAWRAITCDLLASPSVAVCV